jgi:hypothetical protein
MFCNYLAALRIEKRLKDVDTIEEEEVTLEVVLSKPDARGKWLKDGKIIYPDQKYEKYFYFFIQSFLLARLFSRKEILID